LIDAAIDVRAVMSPIAPARRICRITQSRATKSCQTHTLHIVLGQIHKGATVATFIV